MATTVGLLLAPAATASAQSLKDAAAFYAMMISPYGALPTLVTPGMVAAPVAGQPAKSFDARYGRWEFDQDDDQFYTIGLGGRFGNFGVVVGYEKIQGGDEGVVMGGLDYEATLVTAPVGTGPSTPTFLVGLRPSIGYGTLTGDEDMTAFALNVDVPFSLSMPLGTGGRLVPFVSAGYGLGKFDSEVEEELSKTGTRAAVAAGVAFFGSNGLGVHLAWRKIIIDEGPSALGLGVSFGR
jgi:hypothetical protein